MKPADTALEGLCAHDQHLTNEGELDLRLHVPIFLVSRTRYMRAIFFSQPYCIYAAHATGTAFGFNIEYRSPQKVSGEETISGGIYIGE